MTMTSNSNPSPRSGEDTYDLIDEALTTLAERRALWLGVPVVTAEKTTLSPDYAIRSDVIGSAKSDLACGVCGGDCGVLGRGT
jgi:hypothetical protein